MTQMTNQKKTELIDFFDLVWIKNPQFLEYFLKMEAIFPKTSLKIVLWRPPLGTKIPKRVQLFRHKFQKGSISTLYSGTPPSENIMSSPPGITRPIVVPFDICKHLRTQKGIFTKAKTKTSIKR